MVDNFLFWGLGIFRWIRRCGGFLFRRVDRRLLFCFRRRGKFYRLGYYFFLLVVFLLISLLGWIL